MKLGRKIAVKVVPNSRTEELIQQGDVWTARLNAPAKEGRANVRLIELVARSLRVPKQSVRIIRGLNARNKILEIK